jgi:O-antigen/teichoic acid export membrane protein
MTIENEQKPSLRVQSSWLLAAKTIGFFLGFLLPFLVVRYLEQTQVGIYRQAFQVITTVVTILPLGFNMSVYYFLGREKENRGQIVFNILLFNFVVGGLGFLILAIWPQLLSSIFHNEQIEKLAPAIGFVIWLWITAAFLEIVAIANQEPKMATTFIVLSQLTKTALMAGAVLIFSSVESFIYAAMIQGALQILVLIFYLRSRFPGFWRGFDPGIFRRQMTYALPFGGVGLLYVLQNDLHSYFVGNKFTPADYAVYSYGCFQLPLLSVLYESVSSVLIPRMSELQAKNDKRGMFDLTLRAVERLALFYFPAYVLLLIVASEMIVTLFTDDYSASIPIFIINITLVPLSILITDPIVRAFKELGSYLFWLRVVVVAGIALTLWSGVFPLSLTVAISVVVFWTIVERVFSTWKVIRALELETKDLDKLSRLIKTGLAATLTGLVVYLAHWYWRDSAPHIAQRICWAVSEACPPAVVSFFSGALVLVVCGIIYLALYMVLAPWLGVISDEEKASVKGLFTKLRNKLQPARMGVSG